MRALLLSLWVIALASCGGDPEVANSPPLNLDEINNIALSQIDNPDTGYQMPTAKKMEAFGSEASFNEYLATLRTAHERDLVAEKNDGAASDAPPMAAPVSGAAESITNNQEVGVDEGGIVKTVGNYLVILRRGRIFTVLAERERASTLELIDTVNAFPANHSTQTWYDELLVYENKIIVVGYSYGYNGTEIGQFSLDADGKITHQGTYFLRSNDYYSSRNYASRLVDNKLVFYMPLYFYNPWDDEHPVTLPAQSQFLPAGGQSDWSNIINVVDIIRPIEDTAAPVLHTIAICDLAASEMSCSANSVVGPSSRTFYVSPSAVYLWTSREEGASLYRLPLDGTSPGVVLAHGAPTDQFSFKETEDQSLHVLLRERGEGDSMWSPEFREGGVALLSLSLAQFSAEPEKIAESNYAILPAVEGYQMQNRFIGNSVLYGAERRWDRSASAGETLNVYNWMTKTSSSIPLEHDVQRIEALGGHAVVIGSQDDNMHFSSIELSSAPKVVDSFILENSAQGEHRSHGFFYKPVSESEGFLGLPIRNQGSDWGELRETSAFVYYLSVKDNQFSSLGSLDSRFAGILDDDCQASCVDWYGNTRPIFWHGRIFALLGYDLVEGALANSVINEVRRLDFTPHGTPAIR